MLKHLPNALTLARLILAPVIAYAMWRTDAALYSGILHAGSTSPLADEMWPNLAIGLFVVAALTDLFDGLLARALKAESKFGRIIDPIADKALVGLPLIVLSLIALTRSSPILALVAIATAVIVVRDVGMTLLRLAARDGEGARVSKLAKYKTAVELIAVGAPIAAAAAAKAGFPTPDLLASAWLALLVTAAALSAITAYGYLAPKRSA